MKKHLFSSTSLCFAVFIAMSSTVVHAQWYVGPTYNGVNTGYGYGNINGYPMGYGVGNGGVYAYTPGYGFGIGIGNYQGPQTPFSLEAAGISNLVRAQAAYNEETAKATLLYEQARSQYIENQQKIAAAREAARVSNERTSQIEQAKRREEAHESQIRAQKFAVATAPMPLSQSQLDPTSGRIEWPAALKTSAFAESRQSIEPLFALWAKGGHSNDLQTQISKISGEMKDLLRANILKYPLPEYTEARRFLESMNATVK